MKARVLTFILLGSPFLFFPIHNSWAWGWRQAKVVSPEGEVKKIDWNEWEVVKDPAKRDVGKTDEASYHIIHLQNAEPEHTHDSHDLVATVLKGTGKVHFGDQTFDLQKGDVVIFPKVSRTGLKIQARKPLKPMRFLFRPLMERIFIRSAEDSLKIAIPMAKPFSSFRVL